VNTVRRAPILLLGKSGQVGWQLQRSLAPLGEVIALDRHQGGDLGRLGALREVILRMRPAVIVNAAAHTAVDKAESEAQLAHAINALAPGLLAQAAQDVGALFVHFSTDYVFDGSGHAPWTEDAPTGPLNVYGRTKLEGEQRIRASTEHYLILRTSWVYAARGSNFAKTMIRLAREREQLKVIDDQIGAPTGAELIADVTAHAIRHTLLNSHACGTYHLAADGETSWHGYARFVLDTVRELMPETALKVRELTPIPTADYPASARRPLNSRLDTTRLRQEFELALPQWQHGVRRMLIETLSTTASV
jgi:dTDP-4-dehydrorhamnose reductase